MTTQTLIKKINKVERELLKIKRNGKLPIFKNPVSLKGVLKGAKITKEDIEKANKSAYKKVNV